MTYKQAPATRNIDVNHLVDDIASSGRRPLNNRGDDDLGVTKASIQWQAVVIGADKKAGFSSDREKSVRRYLTESENQIRN